MTEVKRKWRRGEGASGMIKKGVPLEWIKKYDRVQWMTAVTGKEQMAREKEATGKIRRVTETSWKGYQEEEIKKNKKKS